MIFSNDCQNPKGKNQGSNLKNFRDAKNWQSTICCHSQIDKNDEVPLEGVSNITLTICMNQNKLTADKGHLKDADWSEFNFNPDLNMIEEEIRLDQRTSSGDLLNIL